MWHIHLLYKLYLYYNYETLKLVIDYPWRWRVLIFSKFQNDKLKTKNSKKMAMIVFHHFFFYETLLLMFTKRTHREITSNALTSNRMSVCNFHYNKRLVRGLRNFFLLFCFPANDSPILAAVRLINFFSFTCLWNEGFFSGFNGIEGKLFSSSQACFSHHFHVTDIWEPEILL